ncbi:MAG: hypothetical protein HOI95_12870, partial [Chromatiales bacterium]|nr:hypothetical protein [Chromatiales bacterium]
LPFLPPYLASRGLDALDIGLVLAAMTAAKVAAPALWGTLSDRSGSPLFVVRLGRLYHCRFNCFAHAGECICLCQVTQCLR